jgi:hypothetical protein
MISQMFFYLGGALSIVWGVAHLFPTKSVVAGFGDISADNRHIITMEWIVEGVALIFIGVLVVVITLVDRESSAAEVVYLTSVSGLVVLALVSLFTGFKVNFLPFKLCPFIFSASAALLLLGVLL